MAGCRCSAFELILCFAVEDWILIASVFCLVSGFWKSPFTWMLKFVMSPWSSGWKSARCFANAFVSFLATTSAPWAPHRWLPENPLSPQYSALSPAASHSLHSPLYNVDRMLWGPPSPPLVKSKMQPGRWQSCLAKLRPPVSIARILIPILFPSPSNTSFILVTSSPFGDAG